MKPLLDTMKAASMAAFIYLSVTVVIAVRTTEKHVSSALMEVGDAAHSVTVTVQAIDKTVGKLDATIIAINATHGPIAILDKDLSDLRLTLDNVNKAAIQERVFLEETQPAEVAKMNSVLDSTHQTIQDVQPVLASANSELLILQAATQHLDAVIADPHLTATIANADSTTKHLDATSSDVKDYVHGILHPTWPHRIWGLMLDIGSALNPFHL